MEKITEKIAALPNDANYFSLEFFPPRTQIVIRSNSPWITVLTSHRGSPIYKLALSACLAHYVLFSSQ